MVESENYEQSQAGYQQDELDSGVSADAFGRDPVLEKYQTPEKQQYWKAELEASRKERQSFINRGIKTIERYADKRSDDDKNKSNYNLFHANTEIKLAALYAQTPNPDIKRRFNDPDDDVSRVAANLLTRNIAYELECNDFDGRMKQMLFDYKVPGIGVGWLRFEQEGGELAQVPATDQLGQPLMDPMTGEQVMTETTSPITNQLADIDHVAWDDFYWSPARTWTLVRWVARRIPMSRDAVKARFEGRVDGKVLKELSFKKCEQADGAKKDSLKPKHQTEETVDVYEIWDKECSCVFWIAESAELPLDVQEDENQFDGFFPTPLPPLGRFTTSSTIPVSDFSLVQDQYNELDDLNNRCSRLTQAMQLKWVYDSTHQALKDLYTTTSELEGIPVNNWDSFAKERGGLNAAIQFAPMNEISDTYAKLSVAREEVKNQINEIEGIADFMRGATAANETTLATSQKAVFGTTRLSIDQQCVAHYCEELLRLKADLICKFYTPEIIIARAGTLPEADQPYVQQAVALLKNEQMRHFRLTVSVDSIQLPNWNLDKAEKTEVFKVLMTSISEVYPMIQQQPEMTPFIMKMVRWLMSGFKGVQSIEGEIDQAMQQFIQAQAQQQQQPPKPSPEEIKARSQSEKNQTDLQITQMQEQTKQKKIAAETQIDFINAQLADKENQIQMLRAQVAAMKTAQGGQR